jgi:UDP-N-acetylmuramoyl-L-alanyl-D-glutamate--2,6-diaminopimelate ligase
VAAVGEAGAYAGAGGHDGASGLQGTATADVCAVADRRVAIGEAISRARPGDVVVIAGKGHEQGQEFADGHKLPFDDVAVARSALGARVEACAR